MFKIVLLDVVFYLLFFNVSVGFRRIEGGEKVKRNQPYVVYLVKAELYKSSKKYDTWLCGGALVSSQFVLTSAACLNDVEHLYVIAGYNQYISDEYINTNACTKQMRKKVIYTCIPMRYQLNYDAVEKWSFIDIAVAKVESPYNFSDNRFTKLCSYIPKIVDINYELRYQAVNTDSIVLGWGHTREWRKPSDHKNYNEKFLRYAPTLIMDKELCKKYYEVYPDMADIIDGFMICTLEKGNINDEGLPIIKVPSTVEGCDINGNLTNTTNVMNLNNFWCKDANEIQDDFVVDYTRREIRTSNQTLMIEILNRALHNIKTKNSRRSGICQNDHGGPLVTWLGSKELLIGVASVFKVADNYSCIGPYLYVSTHCNGVFLDCILNESDAPQAQQNKSRRALCDSPPIKKGYDTIEKDISWKYHPSGPADNER